MDNYLERWKNRAEFTVSEVRSSWSTAFQTQKTFQEIEGELEKKNWNDTAEFGEILSGFFLRKFSTDYLNNSSIWAFNMVEEEPDLAKAGLFQSIARRSMEKSFVSLCFIQKNWQISNKTELKPHEKFLNGVFGQNSAPEYLAKAREGILTPVFFRGKNSYLIWKAFKKDRIITGGIIAIFNESFIDNNEIGIQSTADNSLKRSKQRFASCFFRSRKISDNCKIILPRQLSRFPDEKSRLSDIIRGFWQTSNNDTLRKIIIRDGYAFYIDYISFETPYYVVIVSRFPQNLSFFRVRASRAFLYLPVIWLAFFVCRLKLSPGKIMNLAVSFKALFFLTGMLPAAVFFYIGSTQIMQNEQLEIHRRTENAFSKLNRVNENFENIAPTIQEILNDYLYSDEIQNLFQAEDVIGHQKAFNLVRTRLKNNGFALSYLALITPGKKSVNFCSKKDFKVLADNHTGFFSVSANLIHSSMAKGSPGFKEISLSAQQFKMQETFSSDFIARPEDLFISSLNRVTSLQFAGSSATNFYTCIILKNEEIKSYIAVAIDFEETIKNFLKHEFARLNHFDARESFYAMKTGQAGKFQFLPEQPINFYNSRSGQFFRNFMQSVFTSEHQQKLISGKILFVYSPFSKVKQHLAGGVIDISDIFETSKLKFIYLLLAVAMLGSTIYLLSAYLSHLMIEPLLDVTGVFNQVAKRNFKTEFPYPYRNELGRLSESTQSMIKGLQERQLLGKFVSTTLDANEKLDESFKSAQSLEGVVLFSDIRSFTTLSETHPPVDIARMLNTHLGEMVEMIIACNGQVEQFIGDAIVAFFPQTIGDCSYKAVTAAKLMMNKHNELQMLRKKNDEFVYNIGIGLDFGMVMAGVLSTSNRSEFTILGPARAYAEHLESQSRNGTHTRILVSERIIERLPIEVRLVSVENQKFYEIENLEMNA